MKKSTAKKTLSTLVIALFLLQVLVPSAALAGNTGLDYDNPNKSSADSPYKISLKGIINSRLLTSLVGCTGIVDKVAKVTTQFVQNKLTSKKERAQLQKDLEQAAQEAVPGVGKEEALAQYKQDQKNKEKTDSKAFTDNCLSGIATTLVKNQLTAMTKNTMNWITTGFNGDPMYVRNVDSYMDSLTTGLLKKENDLFKDPANIGKYPWARDYAFGQINAYKTSKDEYGAMKQDLTNYLSPGSTPQSFATDFSQGGWNGWLALTQHPENNPLGFTLKATENLGNQQNKAVANSQAEIARNGGVFDQKRCVLWEKIKPDGFPQLDSSYNIITSTSGKNQDGTINHADSTQTDACIKWATVTPGSVIKTKIDTYVNSPERQIELAKTLNDGLNALFSILINKFEEQGLSGLGSKDNTFTTPVSSAFGSNNIVDAIGNSIASGTASGTETSSHNNGAPFDLTRDLGNKYVLSINGGAWDANTNTPELIPGEGTKNQYFTVSVAGDTKLFAGVHHWTVGQKVFFDGTTWKVGVPNHIVDIRGVYQIQKDYLKSITKTKDMLPKVIPKLAELDYCIPGPNYNWQSNSDSAKNAYFDYLSGVTTEHVTDIWSAQGAGCVAGCVLFNTLGQLFGGGLDHSYEQISLPDPSDYKKIFDDARGLWDKIVQQEFFYIIKNHLKTYPAGPDHMVVEPADVEAQVKKWTDLATKKYDEYVIKAKDMYGIESLMLTEFTPEGNPNPSFLPMAQAGLDLTKNLVTDAEDLPQAISDANDNYAQASGVIYRLNFIKDKVNAIVVAAQNRRKARRVIDGLPAMPQICLDNEKVTWVENDVLKL